MFLRRAKKLLGETHAGGPLSFHWMDIDKAFPQSFAPSRRFALVYGVNVLHVAHDLAGTLGRIREVLRPDGALVISECMRPFVRTPVYVEFVFNLLKAFREPLIAPPWRPNGGFLTPEQWTAALEANGFRSVQIYPELATIRNIHPSFLVAALTARPA
jgi:SAM-dependent methyltransferase